MERRVGVAMVGKREKKEIRLRLPAALVLLVTAALLVTSGGPRGVAADSPVENLVEEATGLEVDWAALEEPVSATEEGPSALAGLVEESAPVNDTYFEDVAFLGDSRTEGFKLYSGLKTGTYYHAVGATVESVFTKKVETDGGDMPLLDAMAQKEFEKIYVMLGVNELGWNGTETYHNQFSKLIDRLREDHPESIVVLQTILPVSAKQEARKTYVNNTRITAYNEVIRELAEEKQCPYLDVAEAVVDENGCLRAEWTSDGVHMNSKGCKVWLEYLRTHPVGEVLPEELAEPPEVVEAAADVPESVETEISAQQS